MNPFYLDSTAEEGLDVSWGYDGRPAVPTRTVCTLCKVEGCETPVTTLEYEGNVWYLCLGTTTRYADAVGRVPSSKRVRALTYRNPVAFRGDNAIVHLGDVTPHRPIAAFLLFERKNIHRVRAELACGNSLYAEKYEGAPGLFNFPYRAQWCKPPTWSPADASPSPTSMLFHRWLLAAEKISYMEHLNDLALIVA